MNQVATTSRLKAAALAGVGTLALAALVLAAGPNQAQAHDICSEKVPDGSVACMRFNHTKIDVCDRQADGHRAYTRILLGFDAAGQPAYASPHYDTNDSQPGCSRYNFPSPAVSWTVCVQTEGCGAVKYSSDWRPKRPH